MEAPTRTLLGNPPRLPPTPANTYSQQTPAITMATADQKLKLDDLPPEILSHIFNMMVREYREDDQQAVFTVEELLDQLFSADSRLAHFNPLEPARVCAALFRAALREIKLVDFVKIPPEHLRANVTLRKMTTNATVLRTMVNLQMTITLGGKEGYPFDARRNESRVKSAVQSLHHLRDTTPRLLHLYIHVTMAAGYFPIQRDRGTWRYTRGMSIRAQDNKKAVEHSLARIMETVRELNIKTVDMSFDPRGSCQMPWEGGKEEAETLAHSMVEHWSHHDYVWRVQGGHMPDAMH